MDTRSKSNKIISVVLALILVLSLAAGALAAYPTLFQRAEQFETSLEENGWFKSFLANKGYRLYWEMKNQDSSPVNPVQVLAPEYWEETQKLRTEMDQHQQSQNGQIIEPEGAYEVQPPVTVYNDAEVMPGDDPQFVDRTEVAMEKKPQPQAVDSKQWQNKMQELRNRENVINQLSSQIFYAYGTDNWVANLDYWIGDSEDSLQKGENIQDLFQDSERLKEYQYAVQLHADDQGNVTITNSWPTEKNDKFNKNQSDLADEYNRLRREYEGRSGIQSSGKRIAMKITGFRNVDLIFAVPVQMRAVDLIYEQIQQSQSHALNRAGFGVWLMMILAVAALFGLGFGLVKKWQFGNGRLMRFLPVEGLIALDVLVVLAYWPFNQIALYLKNGLAVQNLAAQWMLDKTLLNGIGWGLCYLCWAGLLLAAYLSFLSYAKLFVEGPKVYLRQRSWIVRFVCWLGCNAKKGWKAVTDIDLNKSAHQMVIRFVLLNGAAMALLCCGWFFTIPVALIYSAALYYLLKKKFAEMQQDYTKVRTVAEKMAQGDLDAPDTTDAGIYEPLRQDLSRVREGFQKAVDAEVKSQRMKTELITNVSHDLKTPLTAIITYVDLLKKPDITEEERQSYIDTLDKKSQRLKHLIVDLFDVSKAVSREMTPDLAPLDLAALLNQVRFELGERLDKSGLDFRWDIPEQKFPALLDGARTCRMFENLLVNMVKYALPGTRAYVSLSQNGNEAQATFKNISAAELPEDVDALTERFVRGDEARSTEGSGLGLAIVKSFAELQGGRLELSVDGDLFKAVVTFPMQEPETIEVHCG